MHNPDACGTRHPPVRITWCFGLLLVATVAVVFASVGQFDFVVWDDDLHVFKNPRFQPLTWTHVWDFWRSPYEHLYIPVTYSVWAALVWLSRTLVPGQLQAGLFHSFNLLLHLGSVLLVYRVGLLVLSKTDPGRAGLVAGAAAAGALVFGLHPLQVEAVAWVSGLKDVLCGWWAMIAIWQYLESLGEQRGRRYWVHYSMASLAFGLALLAKPAAVVVPLIAAALAVGGFGQPWATTARTLAGWLVVAGLWGIWSKGQQPDAVLGYVTPWWGRPLVAADALMFYLGKLVWPVGLGADYGRTPQVVLGHVWRYVTGPVIIGIGLGLCRRRRDLKGIRLAALVFVAALLPILGVVPFLFQAYSTVADRYVYLALLGPALGLGHCLLRAGRCWPLWVVSILLLGLLGWRTTAQVQVWRDTVTLFTHVLRVNPRSALAHNNLGWTLAQQNELEQAIRHYTQAVQLKPTMLEAYYNLGDALAAQDKLDEAIRHYTSVLELKPSWAEVHNNLGTALMRRGDMGKAITHYARAIQLKPDWSIPYNNMGDAMARQERVEEAISWFNQAVQRQPELPEAAYNLGGVLRQQGRIAEAIPAYREALRRRPDWPQAANNLAWLLTRQENPSSQDTAEAVALAELACRATRYSHPVPLRTLAAAYHLAEKWQASTQMAQHALTLAQAMDDATLVAEISEQLQSYERRHAITTHR